jgi:hypothetical protein
MDDCVIWAATSSELRKMLVRSEAFLQSELRLQVKPEPVIPTFQ